MSIRTSVVAASVVVLASAAPALAQDHLMKVGEVMLANSGGSTAVQFIELEDPGEGFPSPPYSLVTFTAGGAILETIALTVPGGTTRLVVATAQAKIDLSITTTFTLAVTLPPDGQACFRRSSTNIHCFGWGTVTTGQIGVFGTDMGASPGNGMSVQRVNGNYVVAAPTPNAANAGGTPMVDAPPLPPDAAVPDAPGATPDAPDGNPVTPMDDDDGCSASAGASWFGLAMLAVLLIVRRSSTRRKR